MRSLHQFSDILYCLWISLCLAVMKPGGVCVALMTQAFTCSRPTAVDLR